jgi:hypothetical protein
MYHNDMVKTFGPDHAVPCTLVDNCLMHGISKASIKIMGALIASDVVSQNEANLHCVLTKKSHIDREEHLLEAKHLKKLLKDEMKELRNELKEMKGMLGNVLEGLSKLTLSEKPAAAPPPAPVSLLIVDKQAATAHQSIPEDTLTTKDANRTLMIQSMSKSKGQQIIEPKKLQEITLLQLLINMRLQSV